MLNPYFFLLHIIEHLLILISEWFKREKIPPSTSQFTFTLQMTLPMHHYYLAALQPEQ